MPTNCTIDIRDSANCSLKHYLLRCARSNGILDVNTSPSSLRARDDHLSQIEEVRGEFFRTLAWSADEADREAQLCFEKSQAERESLLAKRVAVRKRYEAMLAETEAWTPPTAGHQWLKDFAIQELKKSIEEDCGSEVAPAPERLSGKDYKERQLRLAMESLRYHTEALARELRQAAERAGWIGALLLSLDGFEPQTH